MALSRHVRGWTYPNLGQDVELSVVRFPGIWGRITYRAGVLGAEIDPELATAHLFHREEDPGIQFMEFGHEPTARDGRPAAAALLRSCIDGEGLLEGDPRARLIVPRLALDGLDQVVGEATRASLATFGFRECWDNGELTVPAIALATDLDTQYPQLRQAVAIPSEPA